MIKKLFNAYSKSLTSVTVVIISTVSTSCGCLNYSQTERAEFNVIQAPLTTGKQKSALPISLPSTDNLGIQALGLPLTQGNGEGDLFLALYEVDVKRKGKKRSLLLDLAASSLKEHHDLNGKHLLAQSKGFKIILPEAAYFISQANNINELKWSVFAIMNHITDGLSIQNPEFDHKLTIPPLPNYGLISTQLKRRPPTLTVREIEIARSSRAGYIMENIKNGLLSNSFLLSFSTESSAFKADINAKLGTTGVASGHLNSPLKVNYHKIHAFYSSSGSITFDSNLIKLGEFTLKYDKDMKLAELIYKN